MKHRLLSIVLLLSAVFLTALRSAAQDTFTSVNEDGITLTYMVTDATNHYVQVGDGTNAAFSANTTALHIPATVNNDGITYRVKKIGDKAFYKFSCMMVFIPEGVEEIGVNAFMYCSQKSNYYVYLPSTLTTIQTGAFRNSGLTGTMDANGHAHDGLYIPETVKTINGSYNFGAADTKFTKVYIPAGVSTWGSNVFQTNVEEIVFSPNLTTVPVLWGTSTSPNVTRLVLPPNVQTIASKAFIGFQSISEIVMSHTDGIPTGTYAGTSQSSNSFSPAVITNATLTVAKGMKDKYADNTLWSQFPAINEVEMVWPSITDNALRSHAGNNWDSNRDGWYTADEVSNVTSLNYNGANYWQIGDLSGLETFANITEINVDNNAITGADLSAMSNVSTFSAAGQSVVTNAVYMGSGKGRVPVFRGFNINKVSNLQVNGATATATVNRGSGTDYLVLTNLQDGTNTVSYDYDPALPQLAAARINVSMKVNFEETGFPLNANTVPDEKFRSYISTKYDTDQDGYLNATELATIAAVTTLGVAAGDAKTDGSNPFSWTNATTAANGVKDLTGIELFSGLKNLYLKYARITKLDLSANNAMLNLDLSFCTLLTEVKLGETPVSTSAGYVKIYSCTQLTNLDLSPWHHKVTLWNGTAATTGPASASLACTSLTRLVMPSNIGNTTLNLMRMTAMQELDMSNVTTTAMTTLILSYWAKKQLSFEAFPDVVKNKLTTLTVENATGLQKLDATALTKLTALGTSYNTTLEEVNTTGLTALKTFNCCGTSTSTNNIRKLDLSTNTALTAINFNYSKLEDFTQPATANSYTGTINMNYTQLKDLDLSHFNKVCTLNVNNNSELEAINVNGLTALKVFYANNNGKLKTIDLSTNQALCSLRLYTCALEGGLDLSKNLKLEYVTCRDNPNLGSVTFPETSTLYQVQAFNNGLKSVDVTKCPGLKTLNIYNNDLTEIDVTQNPLLATFNIKETQIESVDLSKNPELVTFNCQNAQLRSLDLNNNPLITTLNVYGNHLLYADFSKQTALTTAKFGAGTNWNEAVNPQTDTIAVANLGGKTGIAVPAAMLAANIDSMKVNGNDIATPSIITQNGKNYLIIDDAKYDASAWEDGVVQYYYKTGATADSVMMGVRIIPTVAQVDDTPVDVFISPLGQAADGKYYASLYYGTKALTVPAGVTASTYKVADGELTVSHTYNAGEVIPAGQGVIVVADATATVSFTVASTEGMKDAGSMLYGSDDAYSEGEDGYIYYMLGTPPADSDYGVGFWWQTDKGASINNGAHKAYLKVPDTTAAGTKGYTFGGGTTGITTVDEWTSGQVNEFWYTLDGQRLNAKPTQKGVYLKNGKKVVVK